MMLWPAPCPTPWTRCLNPHPSACTLLYCCPQADRLKGDFFSDPSQSSITCAATGVVTVTNPAALGGQQGREVFSEKKNLSLFNDKVCRVEEGEGRGVSGGSAGHPVNQACCLGQRSIYMWWQWDGYSHPSLAAPSKTGVSYVHILTRHVPAGAIMQPAVWSASRATLQWLHSPPPPALLMPAGAALCGCFPTLQTQRVRRVYDPARQTLIYVAYSTRTLVSDSSRLREGSVRACVWVGERGGLFGVRRGSPAGKGTAPHCGSLGVHVSGIETAWGCTWDVLVLGWLMALMPCAPFLC